MNSKNPAAVLARTIFFTGLVISSAIVVLYLIQPTPIRYVNDKTMDVIMASARDVAPLSGSVAIVDLDEQSLDRYGRWPWPRYRLAQLLQKIKESGAESVGIDLILSEPDQTSPQNWQSEIARELGYQVDFSNVPPEVFDHDRYLAKTLVQGPFVIGYEFLFDNSARQDPECGLHPLQIVHVNRAKVNPQRVHFFKADSVVCNLSLFNDAVAYSGFLNATPDADGILRRTPLLIEYEDQLFPSFLIATLMQFSKSSQLYLRQEKSGFVYLALNEKMIPMDSQGNMLIDFRNPPNAFSRVSAADVLDGNVPSGMLDSKIVLVGSSAAGWQQTYQTFNRPVASYEDILAQVMETLVSGRFVTRPQVFLLWETLAGLLMAALLCLAIVKLEIWGSVLVGALCLAGTWLGVWRIFQSNGFLLSPLLPTMLVLANFGFLTLYKTRRNQHLANQKVNDTLVLLKTSEGSLNSIIQTIPDIVFRVDPAGQITFISPAVSKYAVRPEDMLGQPILDLVSETDAKKARYSLNERRTGERATYGVELRLLLRRRLDDRDGEVGFFSVSAEGIYSRDHAGEKAFIGTQGIIRDITAQKMLENKLLQAQKMEVIGNLAAGIAHDLNNILSGLVSYPDLLLLELPADSPIRSKVARIQQSGQKAAAIVQDLVTLARRAVNVSDVIGLNTIVKEYLASPECENLKQAHPRISLDIDLDPDLMSIKGSSVHLSKAIMNIVNNAFEAMPAGGRVNVSTYNTYLDTPHQGYEDIPEGEYVCLQVSDEGVGIGPADRQRIFEPFFTKKMMQRSGTGLGMTVIWATVKDHAGYFDVQSREGEGTRMVLYLPATREIAEVKGRRLVLEDYVGTERILIVDDVPEQLEIAVKMLSKLGYQVSSVSSGEAAVAFMGKHAVDLLVLDMIMPDGIDGLETYRRITAIHPGQKAIIASGYSESERVRTLQKLGAGTYVQKPYTLEKIGIAVRRELDR